MVTRAEVADADLDACRRPSCRRKVMAPPGSPDPIWCCKPCETGGPCDRPCEDRRKARGLWPEQAHAARLALRAGRAPWTQIAPNAWMAPVGLPEPGMLL